MRNSLNLSDSQHVAKVSVGAHFISGKLNSYSFPSRFWLNVPLSGYYPLDGLIGHFSALLPF